jgi:cation:H+ antiporter
MAALAVIGGLVVLTFAADRFVAGAARLSYALRLSPVVIGAVVIGFGTSLPELVVSALAAGQGSLDIAVGNIIGSNVANLTLVMGTAALIYPIAVASPTLRREAPLSTVCVILFAGLLFWGRGLGNVEAAVLAVAIAVATWVLIRGARDPLDSLAVETSEYIDGDPAGVNTRREILWTVVGLLGTLLGAQLVVWGAREIAAAVGLAEGFVGFTVVAIGTSLPELVTSIQAARRREPDLIVGNLLGSNLMNSLLVGGFTGIFGADVLTDPGLAGWPNLAMVGIAVVAALMMVTRQRVDRWEGAVMLAVYAATLPLLPR